MSDKVRIRLTCDRVVGFGTLQYEGDEIEVTAQEATRLVKAGQAEPVTTRTVQTAMLDRSRATKRTKRVNSHAKG